MFDELFADNGVFNGAFDKQVLADAVDVEDSGPNCQGRIIFFFSFFRFLGAGGDDCFVNDSFVEIVFPVTLDVDCVGSSVVCVEELTIFGFLGGSSPRGGFFDWVEESVVLFLVV